MTSCRVCKCFYKILWLWHQKTSQSKWESIFLTHSLNSTQRNVGYFYTFHHKHNPPKKNEENQERKYSFNGGFPCKIILKNYNQLPSFFCHKNDCPYFLTIWKKKFLVCVKQCKKLNSIFSVNRLTTHTRKNMYTHLHSRVSTYTLNGKRVMKKLV